MSVPLSAIGHVVGAVPGRGDRLQRPAVAVDDVAVLEHAVGPEVHVAGGIERSHVAADVERARRAMRPLAVGRRAGRGLDPRRRRRMVAMGVGDEDVRHRLAAHGIEQRRDMRLVERTRDR